MAASWIPPPLSEPEVCQRLAVAGLELATLQGTPRQIAWAESVRCRVLGRALAWARDEADLLAQLMLDHAVTERHCRALAWLAKQSSAGWWLERRRWRGDEVWREVRGWLEMEDRRRAIGPK